MILFIALLALSLCSVFELTTDNFREVTDENNVMVKFFAPWCGHCKSMAPAYEELSEMMDNVIIAEVDCTKFGEVCRANEVRGYPTVKLFKDGEPIQYKGQRTAAALSSWITEQLE